MQSMKGAQFLNITSLYVLFTAAPAAAVFGAVIVPLASILHHYNHISLIFLCTF